MFEIEAKVHITKGERQRLLKSLEKTARLKGKSIKKDAYFGKHPDFFLRIREKNGFPILGIKQKKIEQGMEINKEIDIPLKSKKEFEKLLEEFGYKKYAEKIKKSTVFLKDSFQIEVNEIPPLGYFLEIENAVKNPKDIRRAKKELEAFFKTLGFSPKQFEKRYYLDMLSKL